MKLNGYFQKERIAYNYKLNSKLLNLLSQGQILPQELSSDIAYDINIKELALLKPLTGIDIRGPLHIDGTFKGDSNRAELKLKTDIAASTTNATLVLKEFQPYSLDASIKALQLQKLLYMLKQPHYTDGLLYVDAKISNLDRKNLKGAVKTQVKNGVLDSRYLTKRYKFSSQMPKSIWSSSVQTQLTPSLIKNRVKLTSSLMSADVYPLNYSLKDGSIRGKYKANIPKLNEFYFASQRHVKGGLSGYGEFEKAQDLDFSLNSNIAKGALKVNLHNDKLKANLKSMNTLKLLDMLYYSKIFDAKIDGDLVYNLTNEKGNFTSKLSKGKFTKNKILDQAKKYADIDLYRETFQGNLGTKIDRENLLISSNLHSNTSSIITKNTKLNSKTQALKSKIDLNANGNKIEFFLGGDLNDPAVKIRADELIRKEATKAIQLGVGNYLKKFF